MSILDGRIQLVRLSPSAASAFRQSLDSPRAVIAIVSVHLIFNRSLLLASLVLKSQLLPSGKERSYKLISRFGEIDRSVDSVSGPQMCKAGLAPQRPKKFLDKARTQNTLDSFDSTCSLLTDTVSHCSKGDSALFKINRSGVEPDSRKSSSRFASRTAEYNFRYTFLA